MLCFSASLMVVLLSNCCIDMCLWFPQLSTPNACTCSTDAVWGVMGALQLWLYSYGLICHKQAPHMLLLKQPSVKCWLISSYFCISSFFCVSVSFTFWPADLSGMFLFLKFSSFNLASYSLRPELCPGLWELLVDNCQKNIYFSYSVKENQEFLHILHERQQQALVDTCHSMSQALAD